MFQDKDRYREYILAPSSAVGIPQLRHDSHPTDRAPATAPGRRHRHDLCRPPETPKSISCCWSGAGPRPCSNTKSAPRNRAMHEEVGEEVGHNRKKGKSNSHQSRFAVRDCSPHRQLRKAFSQNFLGISRTRSVSRRSAVGGTGRSGASSRTLRSLPTFVR